MGCPRETRNSNINKNTYVDRKYARRHCMLPKGHFMFTILSAYMASSPSYVYTQNDHALQQLCKSNVNIIAVS